MEVVDSPAASRTDGVAELKRQLDVADADISWSISDLTSHKVGCFSVVT